MLAVTQSPYAFVATNPDSAVVWPYSQQDQDGDGTIDWEEEMHRSVSTPVIKDGILYIADFGALFHCLDARTGRVFWTYDLYAQCWGSPLIADDNFYIGDEDGDIVEFRHSAHPEGVPWRGSSRNRPSMQVVERSTSCKSEDQAAQSPPHQ